MALVYLCNVLQFLVDKYFGQIFPKYSIFVVIILIAGFDFNEQLFTASL